MGASPGLVYVHDGRSDTLRGLKAYYPMSFKFYVCIMLLLILISYEPLNVVLFGVKFLGSFALKGDTGGLVTYVNYRTLLSLFKSIISVLKVALSSFI